MTLLVALVIAAVIFLGIGIPLRLAYLAPGSPVAPAVERHLPSSVPSNLPVRPNATGIVETSAPSADLSAPINKYGGVEIPPANGYEWATPSNKDGLGELGLTNGTKKDGVAVLLERLDDGSLRARRAIYVRAGEDARFEHVDPGIYTLRFKLGIDWDGARRTFRRAVEGHQLADALSFSETKTGDGVVYSKQSVTLHEVINGNAPSTTIDADAVKFDDLKHASQP